MKLRTTPARVYRRATSLVRTDPQGVKTGFVALIISTTAGLVAGIALGSVTGTLITFPGLVVLAPGALGLRGNIFGALSSRFSTMNQLGEFRFSRKFSSPMGQNIYAAVSLYISCSLILAGIAKIITEAFGVPNAISFSEFFTIAVIGAIVPTIVVLGVTVFLTRICFKKEWDLDNVAAPLITATGDMITIPSLVLATVFVGHGFISHTLALIVTVLAVALLVIGLISDKNIVRHIYRQSLALLLVGGTISLLAGLNVQARIISLDMFPILIVLFPPLLSLNGAIGSILSSRIATKLHLGTVRADKFSLSSISEDITVAYLLSVPIFIVLGLFCSIYSVIGHLHGPGTLSVIAIAVIAGLIATTLSNIVGYFTAIVTYRFGLDPDNFAIPTVTSASDLIGATVLMLVIGVFI